MIGRMRVLLPLAIFVVHLLLGEGARAVIVCQQGIMETALRMLLLNTKVHYFKFKNFTLVLI